MLSHLRFTITIEDNVASFSAVVGNLWAAAQLWAFLATFREPRAIRFYKIFVGRMLAANKKQAHTNNDKNLPFDALRLKQSNSFSPGSTWLQKQNS